MNTIKDEMLKRCIKETANRGNNNILRQENSNKIQANKQQILEHKKAEKERILAEKKKI